ncbi:hypothetical protein QTG54_010807 [Skeletonema marinoi]|uniref:Uncharacterized protein n=1 Tax=Skeletonema marinoi TaxID=267567 RepID=A0AAD9D989_9STRA|nr:hypothetical protein QTG54_010807 [Skeletonema marinoi]
MKNEVLYFLAKMAVALAVVDAFIPRAEYYMKEKHSYKEEKGTKETQHQYTNRLTTDLPDKDKMHLHPPHYNHLPIPGFQQYHPHTNKSTDQHVSADQTDALNKAGQRGQSQEPLLHEQEKKTDAYITLLSHPSIESNALKTKPRNQQFDFFRHP